MIYLFTNNNSIENISTIFSFEKRTTTTEIEWYQLYIACTDTTNNFQLIEIITRYQRNPIYIRFILVGFFVLTKGKQQEKSKNDQ